MKKAFIIYGESLKEPNIKDSVLSIPLGDGKSSTLQITATEKVNKLKETIINYHVGNNVESEQSHAALLFVCAETCGKLCYHENELIIPLLNNSAIYAFAPKEKNNLAHKLFENITTNANLA